MIGLVWRFLTSRYGPPVILVLLSVVLVVTYGRMQYSRGFAAAEAEHAAALAAMQVALDQVSEATRKQSADLERYRSAARMLAMEADNEILRDTVNVCVPTPDELQRARDRWSGSN